MKAHTAERHEKEIILSIGMIVKNEEKVLERCLKSLQPLMMAIPSELIIADTGSTDSTVEIAKKYTDNVFNFEWINDFSAARNSTLTKAKGQWYMFIDADEYLDDDIHELVDFFKSLYHRNYYKTIEVCIRNYMDIHKKRFADVVLPRLFFINKDVAFSGKIHETIYIDPNQPSFNSNMIFHHTGYSYNSLQQNQKKLSRNLALMKAEYENNPKDLRLLSHLIQGIESNFEDYEKEKYIAEAINIVKEKKAKQMHSIFFNSIYLQAIVYYKNVNPNYALKLCNEYYDLLDKDNKYVATISIKICEAQIFNSQAMYEQAYNKLIEYFELYNLYNNNKLDNNDLSVIAIDGLTEHEYIYYQCMAALMLSKLNKYNDAFEILDKIDVTQYDGEVLFNILDTLKEICCKSKKYNVFFMVYMKFANDIDANKREMALLIMEKMYYSLISEEDRLFFAKDIIKCDVENQYRSLMKLILNQNDAFFTERLSDLVKKTAHCKNGYAEAIYLAIKHNIDIGGCVDKMDSSMINKKFELITNNHDDFAEYVLNYGVPESYTNNIKRFFWITSLYEKASYRSFELNDQKRYALYLKFVELLGQYVFNIYNPELLEDESDADVLPMLHRFGYYMYRANQKLNEGNAVEYIREMKKALDACESMREIVRFMLDQFNNLIGANQKE